MPASLFSSLDPVLLFLSEDPVLRMVQIALILLASAVVFSIFYATRDMLRRSHSFWLVALVIVIVSVLPIVGFLLYLIVRPTETLRQRASDRMLRELFEDLKERRKARGQHPKSSKKSSSTPSLPL